VLTPTLVQRRSEFDVVPATPTQRRLWGADRLLAPSAALNLAACFSLRGSVDDDALTRAIGRVVRRHDVLRARFRVIDGTLCQQLDPGLRVDSRTQVERDASVALANATAVAAEPFDLGHGPPARAALIRIDAGEALLVLVAHHVAVDGWSAGILLRELEAFYRIELGSAEPEPPAPPLGYFAYASRLADRDVRPSLDALRAWLAELRDAPRTELPPDRQRPPFFDVQGGRVGFVLSRDLSDRLRAAARKLGATPFMLFCTAFAVLVRRLTGLGEVVIGAPALNRVEPDSLILVGPLIGLVPLRIEVPKNASFRGIVRSVRRSCMRALARQSVSFDSIVEGLRLPPDPSRHPVVQLLLNWLPDVPTPRLAACEVRRMELGGLQVSSDLEIQISDLSEISGAFRYSTALFVRSTIERWLAAFTRLLERIAEDPDSAVDDLELDLDVQPRVSRLRSVDRQTYRVTRSDRGRWAWLDE